MKRIVIGAGLIATLAFAAVAFANIRHYHGRVDGGGKVRFVTKVRDGDGETIKVGGSSSRRVPMECDDGASTVGDAGSPPPAMRVNDENRFRGKFTSPSGRKHLHIRGRLTDDEQTGPGHPAGQRRLRRRRDQLRHRQGPLARAPRRLTQLTSLDRRRGHR